MTRRRVKEVINSTGRLKIRERDISVLVTPNPPTLRLVEVKLPNGAHHGPAFDDAEVWVEVSQPRTASFDRWTVGKAGAVRGKRPVDVRALKNFSDASDAVIALKVVAGDGRILASADNVRPDDRRAGEQESILPIVSRPLGELPWTLEIASDYRTVLIVNSRIPSADTWMEQDPVASSLVLPAVLREVLFRLATDENFRESEWGEAWIAWAAKRAPEELPDIEDDDEDKRVWVEQTVEAFCSAHGSVGRLIAELDKSGAEE